MIDGLSGLDYEERLRYDRSVQECPYDTLIPDVFKLQPYRIRKHDIELVWRKAMDDVRSLQENSFYFRIIKRSTS